MHSKKIHTQNSSSPTDDPKLLWGRLASPARVSGGGAQIRTPLPPPRRTRAGQRVEVVVGRRAEVEASRCARAGLPPGAGQRVRARSRAEEGD